MFTAASVKFLVNLIQSRSGAIWAVKFSIPRSFNITDGWEGRWVESTHKGSDQGKFKHSAGKFYGDAEKDKGMA